jgi:hypothetical protein
MSEWGWITLAYATTYLSLAVFVWSLTYRIRRARERLEDLR